MPSSFVFEGLKMHLRARGMTYAQLARGMPRESRLINRLTQKQEAELMSDPALLLMAVCLCTRCAWRRLVEHYRLDEPQCIALLPFCARWSRSRVNTAVRSWEPALFKTFHRVGK